MRTQLLLALSVLTLLLAAPALTPPTQALGQWERLPQLNGVAEVAVAPGAPHVLYAAGVNDVWRSLDGGQTWAAMTRPPRAEYLRAVAVDPRDWRNVYVANGHAAAPYLYHSTDGGQTWRIVFEQRVAAVAVSAEPAGRVTIAAEGEDRLIAYRVLQSDDAGSHWREVWNTLGLQSMVTAYVTRLTPFGSSVVATVYGYHGGSLFRLGDRVEDWRGVRGITPQVQVLWPAPLAVRAGPANTLYVLWTSTGPDALVSLRKSADGGRTWFSITPPLRGKTGEQASGERGAPFLTALAVDPVQPNDLFAAAWWEVRAPNADPNDLTVRDSVFLVLRSQNGGASWTEVGDPLHDPGRPHQVRSLVYSPTHQTLFAATDEGVWRYVFTPDDGPPQIAAWFRRYYADHDGLRLMGGPLRQPTVYQGYPAQMFEKGRAEDHSAEERDPNWRLMYGLLVDEIIRGGMPLPVGGDASSLTYVGLGEAATAGRRVPVPDGFVHGVRTLPNGSVFIPYDAYLNPAPGHTVPPVFWSYLNRADLFPGGWLHDIGLPMTEPLTAVVDKGDARGRVITVQAFQRTVLTYDPLNPAAWQVERANVGRDFLAAFPDD